MSEDKSVLSEKDARFLKWGIPAMVVVVLAIWLIPSPDTKKLRPTVKRTTDFTRFQSNKPVTGTWVVKLPGTDIPIEYTIAEDRGEYFQNGKPVKNFQHTNGTGFRSREPDPLGEFSVVTPAGKLELHDRDGLIVVGTKK